MRTSGNDENLCNDKWLSSLVEAMDEVESLRADDICRSAYIPEGLMAQLHGCSHSISRSQRSLPAYFELA
jgi:hypothetical protein